MKYVAVVLINRNSWLENLKTEFSVRVPERLTYLTFASTWAE